MRNNSRWKSVEVGSWLEVACRKTEIEVRNSEERSRKLRHVYIKFSLVFRFRKATTGELFDFYFRKSKRDRRLDRWTTIVVADCGNHNQF